MQRDSCERLALDNRAETCFETPQRGMKQGDGIASSLLDATYDNDVEHVEQINGRGK